MVERPAPPTARRGGATGSAVDPDAPQADDAASYRGVLMVGDFLSGPEGSHTYSVDLARNLRAAGWSVITTSSRRTRLRRVADMFWTTWRSRRRFQVAIVDVYSGRAFRWAEAMTRLLGRLGKPVVLSLHGGRLPEFRRAHPGRVARLFERATRATAPSTYLAKHMSDLGTPIQVVPNAVDLSRYASRQRDRARAEILWLRSFHPIYAPGVAVEAMAFLRDTHPEARLTMAGPVKDERTHAEVRALVERLGLKDVIRLEAAVPNAAVPAWMDRGDIFLNTALIDNTPVTVLEAMACGLCIVSSSAGGMVDLIGERGSALLVPPGDARALAGAIASVLEEPATASALSARARAQVEAMDWARVLPRWNRLLRECAAP